MPTPKNRPVRKMVAAKTAELKTPFHFAGNKFNLVFIFSVIGLCFLLYGNTIPNGFSLDDEFVMHQDTIVAKGIKGIPELFKKRYAWDQKGSYGYRPVVKVSFALEYALFKDSPHWGHVINILLYAGVCIFLFYFFRKLLYHQLGDYFLLIALLLFIIHPIHSEVVASLKNRDEMLVFLFGFYSSYAMMRWFEAEKMIPRILWGLSGALSLGLGTLCKPDAYVFMAITSLIIFFFCSKGLKGAITSFLVTGLLVLWGTIVIHHRVLPHTSYHRSFTFIENPLVGVHWYEKFPLAFSTIWFYISKMIFPKNLVSYYGYNAFDAFPKWTDFSVLAGIILVGVLFYFVIKNIRRKTALLFLLLLFAGTAFPYTDLFIVGAGIVAERFMFIPSVAFMFLLTYILFYFFKLPVDKRPQGQPLKHLYIFLSCVCLIFTVRIWARNPNWKSHESLYEHDAAEVPNSAKLQSLLAASYAGDAQQMKMNDPGQRTIIDSLYFKAYRAYQRSVDIYPGYTTSWNNMGMIEYTLYRSAPVAISDFEKAIHLDPDYTEAWFNRGAGYEALALKVTDTLNGIRQDSLQIAEHTFNGNLTKEAAQTILEGCRKRIITYRDTSEKSYLRAIDLSPDYYITYFCIARLYEIEGRYTRIVELDSNAIKNGYESDPIYLTLGNACVMLKDTDDAVKVYEKYMQLNNKNYYVCGFLANYYSNKGDMEKARYYKQLYDETVNSSTNKQH